MNFVPHACYGPNDSPNDNEQSGTKPNLVAKILATKIGTFWA